MAPGARRRTVTPAALAVLGVLLSLASAGCERERSRWATLADARKAGAVERGWIPDWVPAGATEIEEAHDPDTNARRLRFRAPPGEVAALGEALPRLRVHEICPSRATPAVSGDWPPAVEAGEAAWTLTYRRAESRGGAPLAVAIERSTSTVYAWSCPARAGADAR